jgi:glycosyltransferase involved in cell wall biosynthesis
MRAELFVTPYTPLLGSGPGLRTYGVVAALARRAPVEVAYIRFGGRGYDPAYDALDGVTMRPMAAQRGSERVLSYAMARLHRVPGDLARAVSPQLVGAADGIGESVRIVADGPQAAAALLGLARRRDVVYLAHNLESGFRGTPALSRFERTLLQTFAESWMATRADGEGALALAGSLAHVRYVPNVVDTHALRPDPPNAAERVLFLGTFTYEPNREALAWLLRDVMPAVWAARPELRLVLAGRGLDAIPIDDGRIETHGYVEDLDPLYAGVGTVLVPLRSGGGSPLKFVEALARGHAVVATDHAAALIEDGVAGTHFLAAADAAGFAAAVVALAGDGDRAAALGAAGRALAEGSYSIDALAELLAA